VSRVARNVQTGDHPSCTRGAPHTSTGEWLLVQVWDGAVLAHFDDELSARAAMTWLDDDEIVILHVNA
jgi:hypothetical protein